MKQVEWPYMNWQHLLTAGVRPWAHEELSNEEEDLFLLQCRNNIEAVLWSLLMAAKAEPEL